VSTTPPRVFAARLSGLPVFDPQGDQVGKVRDVVVVLRSDVRQPRVVGLVVEVFGQRPVFVPMTRVTNIDAGQVITTGLLNMRRFEKRTAETLVIGQMLDRKVRVKSTGVEGVVYDVAMEQARTRDWVLSRVALQEGGKGFRRRVQTHVVAWDDVEGLFRDGDFTMVDTPAAMTKALRELLADPAAAAAQAARGLETILARHTCRHRVDELLAIATTIGGTRRREVVAS